MEIIIKWSELAENQLHDIFDYYYLKANLRIAKKIVKQIIQKVDYLYSNPKLGTKESLLEKYSQEFRYLVEGNYKIIYWIDENIITIAAVFDCRQNPTKMEKSI